MNIHCLNCLHIRTVAIVRGGGAVAHFSCASTGEHRTHLMHGAALDCHAPDPSAKLVIKAPEEIWATQESGR